MNGNVTHHTWCQITNQILDWCEREITWSIFDLCQRLTGGEKWKKKKRKKNTQKKHLSHLGCDNWKSHVQLYRCQTS